MLFQIKLVLIIDASIQAGRTKRYRIINTSVYARITLTIDQHQMRLIEADGIYLDGNKYIPQSLRLSTWSTLFSINYWKTKSVLSSYWIRATIHPFVEYNNRSIIMSNQPNVTAILQYY